MPRKTKEQKMAAALRRMRKRIDLQESSKKPIKQPTPTTAVFKTTDNSLPTFKLEEPTKTSQVYSSTKAPNYDYVASDLKKILILSAAAITLEVMLNLTLRLGFARLLLQRFGIEI